MPKLPTTPVKPIPTTPVPTKPSKLSAPQKVPPKPVTPSSLIPPASPPTKDNGKGKGKKPDNTPLATGRTILYPEYKAVARTGDKAVTVTEMKKILGWETEPEYKARMKKLGKLVEMEAGFGDEYTLIDTTVDSKGIKVRCWNNADHTVNPPTTWNRRYRDKQGIGIAQDILNSGPLIPEDDRAWQFNGEAMCIGRTGLCLSVQHRGIGLVLASQILNSAKGSYWRETSWPEGTEPTMETTISYGVKETRAVVRTFDNTAARTTSDTIETSGLFDGVSRTERLIASKATDNALKLLWQRVDWAGLPTHVSSKTHREEIRFLDLHPKVSDCVSFITGINSKAAGRPLAVLGLLAGECSGLLYLMGSSESDGDEYALAEPIPSEAVLNWDNWDKATEFWKGLAGDDEEFQGLRTALLSLRHPVTGARGKPLDVHATLAKAWVLFVQGNPLTQEDVLPVYKPNATTGAPTIVDGPHLFGGIDRGPGEEEEEAQEKTEEQLAEEKKKNEEVRRQNLAAGRRKAAEARKAVANGPVKASLPELRTRKQIMADQTRKAQEADERAAKEQAEGEEDGEPEGEEGE